MSAGSSANTQVAALVDRLQSCRADGAVIHRPGFVRRAGGGVLHVDGTALAVGDLCRVSNPGFTVDAEVVALNGSESILMPYGSLDGVSTAAEVNCLGSTQRIFVSPSMRGRILNGLGIPIDDGPALSDGVYVPAIGGAANPMRRALIDTPVVTGVRLIDALNSVGEGQRMGVFAPAGAGKSTLLGMLARHAEFDINVIALIGERGRELREFIEKVLGPEGLARSVVVIATSDASSMERMKAAHVAMAIAEYFRDQRNSRVLLLMDSVTRFARALREIGLAAGEPPARRGYPPSVFAELPKLLERAGRSAHGSITGFFTVLMEDEESADPIAEEVRSILDGHLILSRKIAASGMYPAIDIVGSLSRLMSELVTRDHSKKAARIRELEAKYREIELLVQVGEYQTGRDAVGDEALLRHGQIKEGFTQETSARADWAQSMTLLDALAG